MESKSSQVFRNHVAAHFKCNFQMAQEVLFMQDKMKQKKNTMLLLTNIFCMIFNWFLKSDFVLRYRLSSRLLFHWMKDYHPKGLTLHNMNLLLLTLQWSVKKQFWEETSCEWSMPWGIVIFSRCAALLIPIACYNFLFLVYPILCFKHMCQTRHC